MYSLMVDLLLIGMILAVGAFLFLGSVLFMLIDAGWVAMVNGAAAGKRAAARVRLPGLESAPLQPEQAVSRAHSRA